jgi:hypothetical protein
VALILVFDTRDELSIFTSPEMAAAHLEAQDVIDGEYRIVDTSGVRYEASAANDDAPVLIAALMDAAADPDFARDAAQRFLGRYRAPGSFRLDTDEAMQVALLPFVIR